MFYSSLSFISSIAYILPRKDFQFVAISYKDILSLGTYRLQLVKLLNAVDDKFGGVVALTIKVVR